VSIRDDSNARFAGGPHKSSSGSLSGWHSLELPQIVKAMQVGRSPWHHVAKPEVAEIGRSHTLATCIPYL
jgi:hypothetical protein